MKTYTINTSNRKVLSSKLKLDDYQRPLDEKRVGRIAKDFNPNLANFIKCSMRTNGELFIFDGQHTRAAIEILNGNTPTLVECRVFEFVGLTDAERHDVEAILFAQQNGISTQVHLGSKLRAEYLAGDENAIAFHNMSNTAGLEMDFTRTPAYGKIVCIVEAHRAWKSLGDALYGEMLEIIVRIWEKDPQSLRREIVGGMAHFLKKHGSFYDINRLIECLSDVSPRQIIRDGNLVLSTTTGKYAAQIAKLYNKGLSKKERLK